MSTTTYNLGLFKYDTTADANAAFNINTALNNNWDIIDEAITHVDGLPDQTGHSGDLLTTNGTNALWEETTEVHCVVETYVNGTDWYRIYSDGWCEQGGILTVSGTSQVIYFLQPYIDTNYIITYSNGFDSVPSSTHLVCFGNKTTNSITRFGSSSWKLTYWRTEGYI